MKDSSTGARALRGIRVLDFAYRTTRLSTFDLATFDPGLGYMLARGDLNHFLVQDGDSALSAAETQNITVGGGADLPFGITASLQYSSSDIDRYTRVSNGYLTSQITPEGVADLPGPVDPDRSRAGPSPWSASPPTCRQRSGRTVLPAATLNAVSAHRDLHLDQRPAR